MRPFYFADAVEGEHGEPWRWQVKQHRVGADRIVRDFVSTAQLAVQLAYTFNLRPEVGA